MTVPADTLYGIKASPILATLRLFNNFLDCSLPFDPASAQLAIQVLVVANLDEALQSLFQERFLQNWVHIFLI